MTMSLKAAGRTTLLRLQQFLKLPTLAIVRLTRMLTSFATLEMRQLQLVSQASREKDGTKI
jgi:hypothetical protein